MNRRLLLKHATAAVAALSLAMAMAPGAVGGERVTVFAAASLKNALDAANAAWQAETGNTAVASYAASSALARQIEAEAPADLFISADLSWMDYLAEKGLLRDGTRANLLGNRLVLVAPKDGAKRVEISAGFDLASLLGDGRLAMGAVSTVPAGRYGKAALESLGVWSSVEGKVAGAESVRAALALVSRGEAPYGVVYRTDAAADPGVAVVATFPEDSHPPIVYPVAILSGSTSPAAAGYLAFLRSEAAERFFLEQGFSILK
jgi:molybdate transport system substrate-binding protein